MGLRCQWAALDETQIDDTRTATRTPQHLGYANFTKHAGLIIQRYDKKTGLIESSIAHEHFSQSGKSLNFLAFSGGHFWRPWVQPDMRVRLVQYL